MRSIVWLIAGILIITACSRKTFTWRTGSVDVSKYRTFAFLPPGDTTLNSSFYNSTTEEILEEINQDLREAGYVLRPEKPELLILVHTNLDKEIDYMPSIYPYYSPGFYERPYYDAYYYYPDYPSVKGIGAGPGITAVEYPKGTIVIDFIDRKSGDIIWRGKTNIDGYKEVSDQEELEEVAKEVKEEVNTLLNNLPASRG